MKYCFRCHWAFEKVQEIDGKNFCSDTCYQEYKEYSRVLDVDRLKEIAKDIEKEWTYPENLLSDFLFFDYAQEMAYRYLKEKEGIK